MATFLMGAVFSGMALIRVRHLLEGGAYSDRSANGVAFIWDLVYITANEVHKFLEFLSNPQSVTKCLELSKEIQ